jgi:hypothetical protein
MSEPPAADRQAIVDAEHLRVLAICHYVLGAVECFFSLFPLVYVALGLAMALSPEFAQNRPPDRGPPPALGFAIAALGGTCVCGGLLMGGLTIYSGRAMQQRRHNTLSLVIAALLCLWIPFGTLLGVFTFIVLMRPSVARLYEEAKQARLSATGFADR